MWFIGALVLVALCIVGGQYHETTLSAGERHERHKVSAPASRLNQHNTLSYVYIVGVEGVGHHGVSPAIATIARTCNKHVLYELKLLSLYRQEKSSKGVRLQLAKFASTTYRSNDVIIIEDSSFPDAKILRNSTQQQKKLAGHYDLEWTYDQLVLHNANMTVKYLYLDRDFYRAVASHPEFDGGFQQHAQVLHSFMLHIRLEYERIIKKQPNIWRQISYEWFTNMDVYNCTAIVSAVIDFMQWDHCDVEYACKLLHGMMRKERKREVVPEDFAYSQQFNVTSPIPVLDIAPSRTYNFTTVVSKRQSIEIVSNPEAEWTARSTVSGGPGCERPAGQRRNVAMKKQLHCN